MKYKNRRTIAEINKEISSRLLDTFDIIEILEERIDGERKGDLLIGIAKNNIRIAFKDIEKCRKIISVVD